MNTFTNKDAATKDMSPIDRILYEHRMESIGLTWVFQFEYNEVIGKIHGETVAHTLLAKLPGSNAIWVAINAWVQAEYRRRGIAEAMMRVKWNIAKYFGAELLMATVRHDNRVENHILNHTGWKVVQSLEDVSIWTREL